MASTPSKPSAPASGAPTQPFLPGDRATAPTAWEKSSDSAWAEFERLQAGTEAGFVDTAPASAAQRLELVAEQAYAPTEAGGLTNLPAAKPRAPQASGVTVDDVLLVARRANRVCPLPPQWQQMYELLPGKEMHGKVLYPPPPITGAAWSATSAMPKRMALRDHVEWAGRHGGLDRVYAFLAALPEEQWHHIS